MSVLLAVLIPATAGVGNDFTALCADRAAIERVHYTHRLGEKPPFEQTLPRLTLERLVRFDLRKEAALKRVYGVTVTSALIEAEVRRINTTTRSPEILAELKTALGDDPARFARTVASPIVVERLLRDKFENDDALHASARREAEKEREQLLQARKHGAPVTELVALLKRAHSNDIAETTWQLGTRPRAATNPLAMDEAAVKKEFGPSARVLSPPREREEERRRYFADLPRRLQDVLRAQLGEPGDVSAVIEMPGGFALYVAREWTPQTLSVLTLSVPKRGYEEWLETQPD